MTSPFLSIIMPSYMGDYGGRYGDAAKDRERKLVRAIDSVFGPKSIDNFELIVVADGCARTMELVRGMELFQRDGRLRLLSIPKQPLWSEKVRNAGIVNARGQWVAYLDTDDAFTPEHLPTLAHALALLPDEARWAYFDDMVQERGEWQLRLARLDKPGGAGTSNIAHRAGIFWPVISFRWPDMGYDHDRQMIRHLKGYGEPRYLGAGGYMVMHIPRQYDI